jgi:hypothetical protein
MRLGFHQCACAGLNPGEEPKEKSGPELLPSTRDGDVRRVQVSLDTDPGDGHRLHDAAIPVDRGKGKRATR